MEIGRLGVAIVMVPMMKERRVSREGLKMALHTRVGSIVNVS